MGFAFWPLMGVLVVACFIAWRYFDRDVESLEIMSDEELGMEAWFAPSGDNRYYLELELRRRQREESK